MQEGHGQAVVVPPHGTETKQWPFTGPLAECEQTHKSRALGKPVVNVCSGSGCLMIPDGSAEKHKSSKNYRKRLLDIVSP